MIDSILAPKSILVVRPGAMGDILVATPVLPNLRRFFPASHIAFLVGKSFLPVLKANPYVNEIIVFDKAAMGHGWTAGRLKRELDFLARIRARRFDLVIDLLGNLRSAILSLASGAEIRVGYSYRVRKFFYNRVVKARNPQYVVDFNLDSLRRIGIPVVEKDLSLPADQEDISLAAAWLRKRGVDEGVTLVGLFPGGGWESKRWPEEHFSKLGDLLSANPGTTVLLMGGPMEERSIERIREGMSTTPIEVKGLPLSLFAGLVSKLDLLVSNDSGPRYLAVAAGVPSIGLFGPTSSANANPPDPKHTALTYDGGCVACNRLLCEENQCMKGITPEQVFEETVRLLGRKGEFS